MFNSNKHSHLEFFEGMLIGGALSAMSVFLFGTKKGKEFQKEIVHKYHQLCHSTKGIGAFIKSPKIKREMAHFMRTVRKKTKTKKTRRK
jgi:gas vesicle protein